MGILIAAITIILYIILVAFTLHNLSFIPDNNIKILTIVIGIIVMLVVTFIIFSISASGLTYEKPEILAKTRKMLVAVFTPVKGIIIMPYLANIINKLYSKELEQEAFSKRVIILAIVFIVILIFECINFKSIQQGIIDMANKI